MKLKDYISKNGIKVIDIAKRVNCSPSAISLYISGDRTPRPAIARRIVEATGGKVTFDDLYAAPVDEAA